MGRRDITGALREVIKPTEPRSADDHPREAAGHPDMIT
jgi:hypothetical protein